MTTQVEKSDTRSYEILQYDCSTWVAPKRRRRAGIVVFLVVRLKFVSFVSPYQLEFNNWAFNLPSNSIEIKQAWSQISNDVDVLLTHGPPENIFDKNSLGLRTGCAQLLARVNIVKPRLHVFGHIHEGYGRIDSDSTIFVNASTCDVNYQPTQGPIVIDLELKDKN
ncbi:unnamed protein product [Rotaria socialis]|uniref:Calcineurin-like phosphoesterase domain-containing protein n=2 Tax=Rotaria socialis TaxID=392032 RepID=A0A818RPC3_9BILA|nr:unnamed protein product [Rotaria socialis]CAF4455162.1 unnamed protein product [Rotaria socialis]